jgi:hypothetical protein
MKNRMDKEDKLVSDIMKEYQMQSPSEGFTDRVMQSSEVESSISIVKSSPLISKAGWFGIAASLTILIAYLYFGADTQASTESDWLTQFFSNLSIPSLKLTAPDFFSRINYNSPTLFWICVGVAGIALLAVLERILESINVRQFFLI